MSSISRTVMHKLQFAKGIGNREMMRANTLPSITRAKIGCLARLKIYEENARFILASLLVLLYLLMGAVLFNHLERDNELKEKAKFKKDISSLRYAVCRNDSSCVKSLDELLRIHSDATSSGLLSSRDRFDFYGSLFFSGTVISTIGFGSSTPRTPFGRLASIFYGLIGCTCCVLFFNLFLERLVTVLSHILRYAHDLKVSKRLAKNNETRPVTLLLNDADYAESASSCVGVDTWRPSVYKVFVCLLTICGIMLVISASAYAHIEGWSIIDAFYFCFISFATIGFGDMVSHHRDEYPISSSLYRPINFALLSLGACLFYCFFNVSSIVVRQILNYLIKKIDVKLEPGTWCTRKRKRYMGLGLRPPKGYSFPSERSSIDYGDGLLSLKEFLMNQHSNVILLQKELIKSATRGEPGEEKISADRVGPMGILCETFGEP